jgi:hypothetical protein
MFGPTLADRWFAWITPLKAFKTEADGATKFIPLWVKVAVAIA